MTSAYPYLARSIITYYLTDPTSPLKELEHPDLTSSAPLWTEKKGCFVTIKTKQGVLRGCMGTIIPVRDNLGKEIIANAITAATRDPRFPPIEASELDNLSFSVDVLESPEPVASLDELDPQKWGVIVNRNEQRGLLLPALEGVATVEQQLRIACQKAGLQDLEGVEIQKFLVTRFKENP